MYITFYVLHHTRYAIISVSIQLKSNTLNVNDIQIIYTRTKYKIYYIPFKTIFNRAFKSVRKLPLYKLSKHQIPLN